MGLTELKHLQVSFIVSLAEEPSIGRAVDELKMSEEQLMEEAHNLMKSNENTFVCIASYYNIVILGEANCSH